MGCSAVGSSGGSGGARRRGSSTARGSAATAAAVNGSSCSGGSPSSAGRGGAAIPHEPLPAPGSAVGDGRALPPRRRRRAAARSDPFAAAAVAADPLAVEGPRRRARPQPPDEPTAAQRSRPALLGSATCWSAPWRWRRCSCWPCAVPESSGAAASPRPRRSAPRPSSPRWPPATAGLLFVTGVTSGLRARGAPLLFVRGSVSSTASDAALEGVRVLVEVVRDGAVLARGDVPAGAVPGPEALHGAVDAAALSEAFAAWPRPGGRRWPRGPRPRSWWPSPTTRPPGRAALRVRPVAGGAPPVSPPSMDGTWRW